MSDWLVRVNELDAENGHLVDELLEVQALGREARRMRELAAVSDDAGLDEKAGELERLFDSRNRDHVARWAEHSAAKMQIRAEEGDVEESEAALYCYQCAVEAFDSSPSESRRVAVMEAWESLPERVRGGADPGGVERARQ